LRGPIELADARLDDYDAVYYPGGHGPMQDLSDNADSGRLLTAALASGKPLAVVCHAPAAMLATRRKGVSLFAGYHVTAFTNDEEEAVGLRGKARWLVEDAYFSGEYGEFLLPYEAVRTADDPDHALASGSTRNGEPVRPGSRGFCKQHTRQPPSSGLGPRCAGRQPGPPAVATHPADLVSSRRGSSVGSHQEGHRNKDGDAWLKHRF
jgi:hypothetical protein